jgi:hypothetical protein
MHLFAAGTFITLNDLIEHKIIELVLSEGEEKYRLNSVKPDDWVSRINGGIEIIQLPANRVRISSFSVNVPNNRDCKLAN